MAERKQDETGEPDDRRQVLLARREEQRRRLARRRRLTAGALVLAVAAVVAVVAIASSGGGSGGTTASGEGHGSGRHGAKATSKGSGGADRRVRNATPQPGWQTHTGPVPILEYHVIGPPPPGATYPELFVSFSDFRRQMNWLDGHGYQAVTLEQVEDAWYHGGTLPPKPVVLSFDDGYQPQYTFALPQLRKHGWAGVLNLKAERSELYKSNVRAMIAAGWEVAAHTIHHLDLTELDSAQLREEVAGSRKILQRRFGVPVKNFCYPAGRFDETVIAAVKAAGYVGATTEIPGYASRDKPYELARYEILGSAGVSGMAAALSSGEGA